MSDEQPFLISPPMSLEEVRKHTKISEDFFTVYCNHIRVSASQAELRVFVGESYPTATGELIIIENLSIAMSPQQAKSTLDALARTIGVYEKNFGPIKPVTGFPTQSPPSQPPDQKPG